MPSHFSSWENYLITVTCAQSSNPLDPTSFYYCYLFLIILNKRAIPHISSCFILFPFFSCNPRTLRWFCSQGPRGQGVWRRGVCHRSPSQGGRAGNVKVARSQMGHGNPGPSHFECFLFGKFWATLFVEKTPSFLWLIKRVPKKKANNKT